MSYIILLLCVGAIVALFISIATYFEKRAERMDPVIITDPVERHNGRDKIEHRLIPMMISKLDKYEPNYDPLAKRHVLKKVVESNNLDIKFEWHLFEIGFEMLYEKAIGIQLYTFPTPEADGEAYFGIILFDFNNNSVRYYTLDKAGDKMAVLNLTPSVGCELVGEYNDELTVNKFKEYILKFENNG